MRPLKEVNTVCCLKMVWRVASSHTSLWVNWVKCVLLKKDSFSEVKEKTNMGLWVWRKLLKYRGMTKLFYKLEIQNRRRASFWYDNWSPLGPFIDITGPRGFIDFGIPSHKTVADALIGFKRRRHRTEHIQAIQNMLHSYHDRVRPDTEDISL